MRPWPVGAYTVTCAAGAGLGALAEAIRSRRSGLAANDFPGCDLHTWIGRVDDPLLDEPLPCEYAALDSRNNRLAWLALQQDDFLADVTAMVDRYGAARCGVILGTSTSSIGRTEEAYRQLDRGRFAARYVQPAVHNPHSAAAFVAQVAGIDGPVMTVGTACSSSAKVFASAARWLEADIVDAALLGGVDSLCLSVLYGFNSLQLLAPAACRPFDVARAGINIGEAAGFALLTREPGAEPRARLLGYGESADAYHMSSPHPQGLGAELAMRGALGRAGCAPADVGYLNLHGTATRQNDSTEGAAAVRVFGAGVAASSTKGWTGHALGAAGILEAVVTLEAMRGGLLPGTLNLRDPDPDCGLIPLTDNAPRRVGVAMSNSFGFGGSNCSLLFGEPR